MIHRNDLKKNWLVGFSLLIMAIITILYGASLEQQGIRVRRWYWENLLWVAPVVPMLLLQKQAGLPQVLEGPLNWKTLGSTFGIGIVFGLLDVLVIKIILHPQPYTELPPFLQPFPYSIPLYFSGALEVELYYRMIPLTLLLCADRWIFASKFRKPLIITLAIVTSLIEPILQFPDGAWWFIAYATVSGIAMNAWQFKTYLQSGFLASMSVRLGHYLIWHISLGLYVQYIELAGTAVR